MSHERTPLTPLKRMLRGLLLWMMIVLMFLILGGVDTRLQMQLIAAEAAGPLPFLHYVFFLYSPFILSALCGVLFAPMIAYPFRDFMMAKGRVRLVANGFCVMFAFAGALTTCWIVLASWVAIRDLITKAK